MSIAVTMIVKNESKRILITLESVKNYINSLIIYDTGSTDNTIDIIKTFSQTNNLPLHLKQGIFENFSKTRNELLDFADTIPNIDFLLLMDCNDELKNGDKLTQLLKNTKNTSAFLIRQEWWYGESTSFFNIRLIRPKHNWKYVGSVHEVLINKNPDILPTTLSDVYIFQDRTQDDNKTAKRFQHDIKMLENDLVEKPNDPRTLFYLAQTYSCLDNHSEAYYFYKQRILQENGFWEEISFSLFKCGELSELLNLPWETSLGWYMKCYEYYPKVEPLIKIVNHYMSTKKWALAYTFCNLAIETEFPEKCSLFITKTYYDYTRYHLMGIIGWYNNKKDDGIKNCKKAIEYLKSIGKPAILDENNLLFYLKRM